jgi:hypothetical protein
MAFMQTVMSGDPEGFWGILRVLIYHADTLLQLSEGYRYREGIICSLSYQCAHLNIATEHSTAVDFIERAIFAYERAFVGSFSFLTGSNRLDFDAVENRPFFLAVHRLVIDLQRRGCFRTAMEFGRLLLSLDPSTDPHGALLHLDYLAIKSGNAQWLLDIWDFFAAQIGKEDYKGRINVTILPGWAFARALALHGEEEAKKKVTIDISEQLATRLISILRTMFKAPQL